ncbi:MAG: hypothetical protein QQN61_08180 [Nitrosopumilus sp.]
MKYMCRTCKKECDDILEHLIKEHNFSKKLVEDQLKTNPDSYQSAFEKLKNDRSKTTIQEKGRY